MPVKLSGLELSVWLSESREEVPVYGAQTAGRGILTASIPSEEGKSFEVLLRNNLRPACDVEFGVHMDGRLMRTLRCRSSKKSRVSGVRVGEAEIRPFTFSRLQLKEDDGEAPACDLSKLGCIEVHVCRINSTGENVPNERKLEAAAPLPLGPISEKAKKLGHHSVELGAARPGKRTHSYSRTMIDQKSKPYAVFRFWYKPIELLRAEGVAPPAEPAASPAKGKKRARADEEEEAEAAKRPALEQDVKPDISQPFAGSSQVKVEGAKRVKSEVIDLTERPRSPIRVPVNREVIEID